MHGGTHPARREATRRRYAATGFQPPLPDVEKRKRKREKVVDRAHYINIPGSFCIMKLPPRYNTPLPSLSYHPLATAFATASHHHNHYHRPIFTAIFIVTTAAIFSL